ncbi:MAG: 4-hydroxy-2-oxovalerate aldolase [Campylobacteraceae bacterium]
MKKKVTIYDVTLRDGSHAISHQLTKEQVDVYTKEIDKTGIHAVEVGHGNGLGASSVLVGKSLLGDRELLEITKNNLQNTKLGIHLIPGFATINKDLKDALKLGVDIVRVACHCTEADITQRHIEYTRNQGKEAYGLLMMSHMISAEELLNEAIKMQTYGAECIVILDSSGSYLPDDVKERISLLHQNLKVPIGFHAHNNLGLSIANSLVAVESGAQLIDCATKGFGAGAGNTQMEVLVAVLGKMGYQTDINLYKLLDVADVVEKSFIKEPITISSLSIISALSGVFSGFSKHVKRIAKEYDVDPRDIFMELGKAKVIAGQEDKIIEIASKLKHKG